MRVLLIATNRHDRLMNRLEVRPLPLGVAYLASHLDIQRHTLKVLDLMFSTDYLADTEATVGSFRPQLVGLSLRNLDNQSYLDPQWALPIAKAVIERIRANADATIVCGGPAFSILPKECFLFLNPDIGIAGDAGETFGLLADRIEAGQDYHNLPGLVYRRDNQVVINPPHMASNFLRTPRLDYLDITRYREAGFGIGVITKLANFYYLTAKVEEDIAEEEAGWRIRPISDVIQELKDLKRRFGIQHVFFVDSGFNIPLTYAKALCRTLMRANLHFRWNAVIQPGSCDTELIELMRQSGCTLALLALSGVHQAEGTTLYIRLNSLERTCQLCEEGGLPYSLSMTFGEPYETQDTVDRKLNFLRERHPALVTLRVGVRILPGTSVAKAALKERLITSESQLLQPTFYVSQDVKDWLVPHLQAEAQRHPEWSVT